MSKNHQFVSIFAALVFGVGLIVAGSILSSEPMLVAGTGLVGLFTGAIAVKRPADM
jgi:hypothetical protein